VYSIEAADKVNRLDCWKILKFAEQVF